MRLYIGFVLGCCLLGVLLRRRGLAVQNWLLFGLCMLMAVGYYFLNQI